MSLSFREWFFLPFEDPRSRCLHLGVIVRSGEQAPADPVKPALCPYYDECSCCAMLEETARRVFEESAKVADEHTRKDYSWECSEDFRRGYEQAADNIAEDIRAKGKIK